MRLDDTIAAVCSPSGGAARGIVRLSGADVVACLAKRFFAADGRDLAALKRALVVPGTFEVDAPVGPLPLDLYLWPTRRSYTGQPAAELHTFGSPPLLQALVKSLCAAGARPADPGEFTMRAFLAGRLDLTQAEAVLGVIDATSSEQVSVALAQLAGGLAAPLSRIRDRLLDLLAHLEAGLDFVEEDIAFITPQQLDQQLAVAASEVAALAEQMSARTHSGDEPRVALVGAPNVGKSSLLNALAGNPAAIVSPAAGTTRDYLCRQVNCAGLICLLIDTAGLDIDEAADEVASAAQTMTRRQAEQADLRVLCLDASRTLNDLEHAALEAADDDRLVVLTKGDLPRACDFVGDAIVTSSTRGAGLDRFAWAVRGRLESILYGDTPVVAGTALRCRESLRQAAASLSQARQIALAATGEELVAVELRAALDELGRVAGAVYTDDILDRIFSRFCIGK